MNARTKALAPGFISAASQKESERLHRLLFLALLTVSTAGHLAFIARTKLDLFPDEAQYWDWSRHPDWSYYSKPPLVAYAIGASRTALGSDSPLAVRLPAVLLGAASTALVYRFASLTAGGPAAGLTAAVAFRLAPVFVSEAIAMTTDSLLLVFWALAGIFLYRASIEEKADGWLGFGLAMALGVLSKYTMLVALVWAAGAWAAAPGLGADHRRYAACALAMTAAGFIPPLAWNVQHGWVSFLHVASNAGRPGHVALGAFSTVGEFLGGQLLVMTPLVWLAIAWSMAVSWRRWRSEGSRVDLFLLWGALPLFAMYLATSFVGRAEANWPAPAYVAGLAAFVRHTRSSRPRLARAALVLALPFTLLVYDFDLVYALGIPVAPKRDPLLRMRGWKELGAAVGAELARLPAAHQPFPLADSYQIASELAFYVPGKPVTYCADVGRRQNQYDYWPGFSSFLGRDAVYATEGEFPHPHFRLRRAFERWERAPTLVYCRFGKPMRKFTIFRFYGFKGMEKPDATEY